MYTRQDAIDATPTIRPINPFKGFKAFMELVANKEDTSRVFEMGKHLNGKGLIPKFQSFLNSDYFQVIKDDPDYLLRALEDREALRQLPLGTFGRIYADFMDKEGLNTNGIEEAAYESGLPIDNWKENYPLYYTNFKNNSVNHDLFHILTGYHRDALGELSLLCFTYKQGGGRSIKYIAQLGSLKIKSETRGLPVWKCLAGGFKMGEASAQLSETDLTLYLDKPLSEVREALNIVPCPVYQAIDRDALLPLAAPVMAE